jgi:hypothetical protein
MLFSTLMQILSLIIRSTSIEKKILPFNKKIEKISLYHSRIFHYSNSNNEPLGISLRKHSFRTKNEVQIDHKKLSDLLKLKAQPNQQQNNERIPSTNVNLEEKTTSTEKRTVKKRKFNETVETGEEIGEEIEKKCKLFCCISAECAATFIRSSSLKNHLETKSHYYGKSGATHTNKKKEGWSPPTERISVHCIEDKMIGVVKDAGNHLDNRNHTNRRGDNAEINVGNDINNNGNEFETMVSGSVTVERLKDELYSLGHGEKKTATRKKRNKEQYEFVKSWIEYG